MEREKDIYYCEFHCDCGCSGSLLWLNIILKGDDREFEGIIVD